MILYMAGGVSGNLKPLWKETCQRMAKGQAFTNATEDAMKIFLAGGESRHWIQDELLEFQKKNELRRTDATLSRRGLALAEWGGV